MIAGRFPCALCLLLFLAIPALTTAQDTTPVPITQSPLDYLATDLGAASSANGINDAGLVVGWAEVQGVQHAALWHDGDLTDLGALAGDDPSVAYAVNAAGQVVGEAPR